LFQKVGKYRKGNRRGERQRQGCAEAKRGARTNELSNIASAIYCKL